MQEQSLIALRSNDHMIANNLSPSTIVINKEMLYNVRSTRKEYGISAEENKKREEETEKVEKEKFYQMKLVKFLQR